MGSLMGKEEPRLASWRGMETVGRAVNRAESRTVFTQSR